ncbi:hypothetical protein Lal_00025385 [Lupinus albus]|nr:hypothetical protein Lal_00025385 [Lupinus albus]
MMHLTNGSDPPTIFLPDAGVHSSVRPQQSQIANSTSFCATNNFEENKKREIGFTSQRILPVLNYI